MRSHAAIASSSVVEVDTAASASIDSDACSVDSQVRVLEVSAKTVAIIGGSSGS